MIVSNIWSNTSDLIRVLTEWLIEQTEHKKTLSSNKGRRDETGIL